MIKVFDMPNYNLRYVIIYGMKVFLASDAGTIEPAGHNLIGLAERLQEVSYEIRFENLPEILRKKILQNEQFGHAMLRER